MGFFLSITFFGFVKFVKFVVNTMMIVLFICTRFSNLYTAVDTPA
jgi:hypothetical protein